MEKDEIYKLAKVANFVSIYQSLELTIYRINNIAKVFFF